MSTSRHLPKRPPFVVAAAVLIAAFGRTAMYVERARAERKRRDSLRPAQYVRAPQGAERTDTLDVAARHHDWIGDAAGESERERVERALRQSEERTRQILATSHDAFVSVDKHGRIIDWNPAAEETFGWTHAEAIGRGFAETLVTATTEQADGGAVSPFSREVKGRVVDRRIELVAVHRDGRELPVELTICPLRFDGDHVYNVFLRDITERRQAALALEQERDFLNAVLESLKDGVVACGADGALSLFNRAMREMHGATGEQTPPEDWASHYQLFVGDGQTPLPPDQTPLSRTLRGERVRDVELVIAPEGDRHRTVLCNGQPIESKDGRMLGAVVAMHDVTERRKAEEELLHRALHDSLTGLPNRALFLDRLRHALAVAGRGGAAVAVLFADLDHFKRINDSLGHLVGDDLLVAVAGRLSQALRAADTVGRPNAETVARLGGDEFVVLCEGLSNERDAIRIAERMADTLEPSFMVGGEEVFASASIGIALSSGEESAESLLRDAGAAMHRAKERGRGRSELFDEATRKRVVDRLRRENELRRAIDQDELRLCYQPIVSVPDRRVVGVEALVRWQHPDRGLLGPEDFVELAEESGLILALGGWALRGVCRQLADWQGTFGERLPLSVSVNVSARQLGQPQIVEELEQAVSEAGADPSRLALEITETVLMEDGDAPVAKLEALKSLGTRLVLDDFGTGYSSLSYLGRLPLDTLKLDRSFVAPLAADGEGRDIAAAVVQMAHALNMSIVAEGVETEPQLRVLSELGCDMAQGYLLARPLWASDMTDLLATTAKHSEPRGIQNK